MFQNKLKEAVKVTLMKPVPTITISQLALDKMQIYIESVSTEIGWLGTIEKLSETLYHIDDVFLLEQTAHGTNTTITTDGQTKFIMDIMEQGKLDIINKMKFWGHSHVNMDVSPSGQDEETLKMLKPDVDPDFFLRGIFNKAGKVKFTLYDYTNNMIVDNVDWKPARSLSQELIDEIKQEIEEKVIVQTVVYNNPNVIYSKSNGLPRHIQNRFPGLKKLVSGNSRDDEIDDSLYEDGFDTEEEYLNNLENELEDDEFSGYYGV